MSEETRDEQFQQVLDTLRIATNLSIGARPDSLYDLLDAVENLINPEYEGDEDCVREALDTFQRARLEDEAEAAEGDRSSWRRPRPQTATDSTQRSQLVFDGITYDLVPTEETPVG